MRQELTVLRSNMSLMEGILNASFLKSRNTGKLLLPMILDSGT
ncbi:hypothetical protein VB005_08141 [Metarhizium brunneum]